MSKNTLNQKSVMFAWAMYDWANSVFALTIRTAIFPIYYNAVTKSAAIAQGASENGPYWVHWLGIKVDNSVAYSYNTSLAFLLVSFITPILSGVADFAGKKKLMMQIFCLIGSLACMALYFFTQNTISLALWLLLIATISWNGSLVFYNAFLPEIATEDRFDKLSATGFSLGYLGSVLLLILNLVVIQFPQTFFPVAQKQLALMQSGISEAESLKQAISYYQAMASRWAFLSVGVWWILFAQITFWKLPKEKSLGNIHKHLWWSGFKQLQKVWHEIQHLPKLKLYLASFFMISVGLQTTMNLASLFGAKELKLPDASLIIVLLLIQLVAIGGAYLFSWSSAKFGNLKSLAVGTVIWIGIGIGAFFVQNGQQFYILACVVGLVMGGMQSLFRATFAKKMPQNTPNHASYFSFFDIAEKLSVVIGAFVFGLTDQLMGSMRHSALALTVFFIIGLWMMLSLINKERNTLTKVL
ncbi:MAG: MFS transporter [Chitinophagales bacterium]